MRRVAIAVPLLAVLVQLGWGRSWELGDFPECGQGTYFLADVTWTIGGLLLAVVSGAVVAGVLAVVASGPVAAGGTLVTLVLLGLAGEVGAVTAEQAAGCAVMHDGIAAYLAGAAGIGALVGFPIGWFVRRKHRADR